MNKLTQLITALFLFPLLLASAYADSVSEGKEISFDRKKGNCLACHVMDDGEMAGLLGPPLMMMKVRFPDRAVLREQVWDATIRNPSTSMPPFGKHRMLTEEELDKVIDYLYTL